MHIIHLIGCKETILSLIEDTEAIATRRHLGRVFRDIDRRLHLSTLTPADAVALVRQSSFSLQHILKLQSIAPSTRSRIRDIQIEIDHSVSAIRSVMQQEVAA